MIRILCVPGHLKRNHLEELNQKCCYCSKKLSSHQKVLRHITIVHFDIREFPCPICNYRFTVKRDVDKHINSAHLKNGQKMETSQNSNDINNFQPVVEMNPTQKGQKLKNPVSCEICKTKFSYLENKKRHLKRGKCLGKPVTPVSCEICNREFGYLGNMRRHLKRGRCLEKPDNKNVQFAPTKSVIETPDYAPAKLVAETPAPAQQATNYENPVYERKKKYSCEICQKEFGRRRNMRKHQKTGRCLAKINAVNKNVQLATAKGQ